MILKRKHFQWTSDQPFPTVNVSYNDDFFPAQYFYETQTLSEPNIHLKKRFRNPSFAQTSQK